MREARDNRLFPETITPVAESSLQAVLLLSWFCDNDPFAPVMPERIDRPCFLFSAFSAGSLFSTFAAAGWFLGYCPFAVCMEASD